MDIECAACGEVITGEPVYDEGQVFWLGAERALPFHDKECLSNAAEAQNGAS